MDPTCDILRNPMAVLSFLDLPKPMTQVTFLLVFV